MARTSEASEPRTGSGNQRGRSVVIGTAGHIDHGKSALVRALTGTDPDRLKEEKARGITIDLGFAHLESGELNLAFVDVPGHERFVKNMLAGAGGIDLVLLVIAADESVMPQTREHFQICRLLRIPAGVVAITKIDAADADMRELAAIEARELVAGSFLENAPIVYVSARTGEGLAQLRATLEEVAARIEPRNATGVVRLPIDRVFTVRGFGTVVTGTLVSGTITPEQELIVLPRGLSAKVRGIQVHGRGAAGAVAGNRVALNLGGVEVADLQRGNTLCALGAFEPSRRADVLVDLLPDAKPLRHGARIRFHHGTSELLGRIALSMPRGSVGSHSELPPGGSAFARVRLESPAVLTRGDPFIVRAYSPPVTVGGGVVLDPDPPHGAIRTVAGRARLARLDPSNEDQDAALVEFIAERGAHGLMRAALVSRAGLAPDEAAVAAHRLIAGGRAIAVGDLLLHPPVLADLAARLLEAVREHHRTQPLSDGLPREEARERIFARASPAVFEHVLADLVARRTLVARDRLALEGHHVSLTPEEMKAYEALEVVFRDAKLSPPDNAGAAAAAGVDAAVADRMLKLMLRQRRLVKVDTLFFHAEALEWLKAEVRGLKAGGRPRVDVAAFKDRFGISRKYAIPLLEYLDRERVTRRVGDAREVL
jgi:selenocysteine-specific elongation factor